MDKKGKKAKKGKEAKIARKEKGTEDKLLKKITKQMDDSPMNGGRVKLCTCLSH